jgi:prepilin-type N-terminal cleavage/methylation domain-containing protein
MKRAARSRGFMLVEVMAALALLGIAFAGLSPLVVCTMRGVDHARRVTAATEFARDKIEDLRSTAYASLAGGSDTVTEGGTGASFARTWTVAAGPSAGTKAVTVTVTWTARTAHTVTQQTIVAQ